MSGAASRPAAGLHAEILAGEPLDGPRSLPVAHGEAWAYTRRAPDKTGPNEDCAAIWEVGEVGAVLAVADGIGGAPSGARASRMAVDALGACLARAVETGASDLRPFVLDGFEEANADVLGMRIGAGTTLVAVELGADFVRTYHAGDSVALVVGQRGRVRLHTIPHSPVGYGVASGMLDPEKVMDHEERSFISNCVGSQDMRLEVGAPIEMAERDTLLVASDGVLDNVRPSDLVELIRRGALGDAAHALAQRVAEVMEHGDREIAGHCDDATFLLYRTRSPRARTRRAARARRPGGAA
ncbi:MAG: protein phosphatase 2C domain-containing protein [Myxococcota bacterium]|nr:protein phosphatase 2C domain-containing protein [Myxococcales bacterium]